MKLKKVVLKDIIFILLLIIIFLTGIKIFYFDSDINCHVAVIEQNNQEINRINLSDVNEPYFIDIDSAYPTKILVEPGTISFYKSTCPDKVCEHYGKLSKKGQSAVCLPAKVIIRIDGQNETIDSITG